MHVATSKLLTVLPLFARTNKHKDNFNCESYSIRVVNLKYVRHGWQINNIASPSRRRVTSQLRPPAD